MRRTLAVFVVLAACQAAILTIGALAVRASVSNDVGLVDLIVLLVTGVQLPLLYFMLQRGRRRVIAAVVGVCFSLLVTSSFVATSVPALAVTDNSSVFTFRNTSSFGALDMLQNYTPTSPTATTCPGTAGFNWQCSWTSDVFSNGQSFPAGTSAVDLYAGNTSLGIIRKAQGGIQHTSTQCGAGVSRPAVVNGDVLLFTCTFRGGTGTTIASVPSGWNLVGARVDNSTAISLVVYSHVVTDAASEPTINIWDLSASVKMLAYYMNYSGVDAASPIDAEANQATPSATSHTAPGVTTTVANGVLLTFHSTADCVAWTPPPGMTEVLDSSGCSGGASSNVDIEIDQLALGAAGPTGDKTATNDGANVGVTKTVALKPVTAPLTCAFTVQLSKPIQFRAVDSNISATSSISVNTPSGVVDGDVMLAYVGYGLAASPITISTPAGWTLVRHVQVGVTNMFGSALFSRVASSEPANYTWNFNKALNSAGAISAYFNVDTSTPIDVETDGQGTPASLTTTQPGDMLVVNMMSTSNTAFTPPAGMTERVDSASGASNSATIAQADAVQAVAGATGTKAPTPTTSTYVFVALKPAAGSSLGSTTASVTGAGPTQYSVSFATPAISFVAGDRLQVDVTAPNDQQNCGAITYFDSTGQPSKLTMAVTVAEGIAGLLLIAPALPLALRWRKQRRDAAPFLA